ITNKNKIYEVIMKSKTFYALILLAGASLIPPAMAVNDGDGDGDGEKKTVRQLCAKFEPKKQPEDEKKYFGDPTVKTAPKVDELSSSSFEDKLSSSLFADKKREIALLLASQMGNTSQSSKSLAPGIETANAQSSTLQTQPQKAKPAIPPKPPGLSQQSNLESIEKNDEFSFGTVRKTFAEKFAALPLKKDPLTQNSKEATSSDKNSSAMSEETGKRKENYDLPLTKELSDELSSMLMTPLPPAPLRVFSNTTAQASKQTDTEAHKEASDWEELKRQMQLRRQGIYHSDQEDDSDEAGSKARDGSVAIDHSDPEDDSDEAGSKAPDGVTTSWTFESKS
ncbi:MAG: hypothetical protein K2P90_01510, partial [Holosporales bacterium]|nr:hypothetical protein [Holosporales bacterium]